MTTGALLSMTVGVVVERSKAASPWLDYLWRPAYVLPGVPSAEPWTALGPAGGDTTAYFAGTATIALYRTETGNYLDNLRWLGFTDEDFVCGGSDALLDALIVAGDEEAIAQRCDAHLAAGATQVAVHPLEEGDPFGRETLRRLAPVLLDRP